MSRIALLAGRAQCVSVALRYNRKFSHILTLFHRALLDHKVELVLLVGSELKHLGDELGAANGAATEESVAAGKTRCGLASVSHHRDQSSVNNSQEQLRERSDSLDAALWYTDDDDLAEWAQARDVLIEGHVGAVLGDQNKVELL